MHLALEGFPLRADRLRPRRRFKTRELNDLFILRVPEISLVAVATNKTPAVTTIPTTCSPKADPASTECPATGSEKPNKSIIAVVDTPINQASPLIKPYWGVGGAEILVGRDDDLEACIQSLNRNRLERIKIHLSARRRQSGPWNLAPLGKCRHLFGLFISDCNAQISDIAGLAGCKSLREIDLSYCSRVLDLSPISGCTHLHTLDLTGNRGLMDIGALGLCKSLRNLNLTSCTSLVDISGLRSCCHLRNLNLSWCSSVQDYSPIRYLASLRVLRLNYCESFTDLSHISACYQLEFLALESSNAFASLTPLSTCTSLRYVSITCCRILTDISAVAALGLLEELDLSYSAVLHDLSPLAFCKRLRSLDLSHCSELTVAGIQCLSKCTNLQKLNLSYCPHLLSLYDVTVFTTLRQLRTLTLSGNKNMNRSTLSPTVSLQFHPLSTSPFAIKALS